MKWKKSNLETLIDRRLLPFGQDFEEMRVNFSSIPEENEYNNRGEKMNVPKKELLKLAKVFLI